MENLISRRNFFSGVGDEDFKKSYPIYMHIQNLKAYDGSLTGMVVDNLLESFLDDYQFSLRTKSNLGYDRVRTFYYKLSNRSGGLYIDSPDWIKNKKATINQKKKKRKKR